MKWLKKFWRWLRPGDVLYPPKTENHFDHAKKVVQSWPKWKQCVGTYTGKSLPNDHLEKLVRSAVDVKPDETVEIRPEAVIIRQPVSKTRLRQNAKQLQYFKKMWRGTDRKMPWKEFRAEINGMFSFGNSFCEAMQMTRDREMGGARAFYKAHQEKRNNG